MKYRLTEILALVELPACRSWGLRFPVTHPEHDTILNLFGVDAIPLPYGLSVPREQALTLARECEYGKMYGVEG